MRYAFFQGCNIPIRIAQYALSTTAVLDSFGVELVEVEDFNCCGHPVRNLDEKAYFLPSARNLALAEKLGLEIMVICNCCFMSLQKARKMMAEDELLRNELNAILIKEGLQYTGSAKVKHFLSVLHGQIGVETIRKKMTTQYKELSIALLHGCHLLRPREITQFDDSFVPAITDSLLETTGAKSLDWRGKLECCGAALAGINNELSYDLLAEKIAGARDAGADFITPICSYCHLQFDTTQSLLVKEKKSQESLPVLLYPQLLGLCLGIDPVKLGLLQNTTLQEEDVTRLLSLLGPVQEKKKKLRKKTAVAA